MTPDTLLAWHRKLIAQKWAYAKKGTGRPRVAQEITDLVLRMARENTSWGYDRSQGALANLGHIVAPNTVINILKSHGIEPAPGREKPTSWKAFLKTHWDVMAATDFFTVEVWPVRGLVTCYVLFVMRIKTRSVHIAGVTTAPNGAYMKQVARNLSDVSDGFLVISVANGLVICSISTTGKQLDYTRSISCTLRAIAGRPLVAIPRCSRCVNR